MLSYKINSVLQDREIKLYNKWIDNIGINFMNTYPDICPNLLICEQTYEIYCYFKFYNDLKLITDIIINPNLDIKNVMLILTDNIYKSNIIKSNSFEIFNNIYKENDNRRCIVYDFDFLTSLGYRIMNSNNYCQCYIISRLKNNQKSGIPSKVSLGPYVQDLQISFEYIKTNNVFDNDSKNDIIKILFSNYFVTQSDNENIYSIKIERRKNFYNNEIISINLDISKLRIIKQTINKYDVISGLFILNNEYNGYSKMIYNFLQNYYECSDIFGYLDLTKFPMVIINNILKYFNQADIKSFRLVNKKYFEIFKKSTLQLTNYSLGKHSLGNEYFDYYNNNYNNTTKKPNIVFKLYTHYYKQNVHTIRNNDIGYIKDIKYIKDHILKIKNINIKELEIGNKCDVYGTRDTENDLRDILKLCHYILGSDIKYTIESLIIRILDISIINFIENLPAIKSIHLNFKHESNIDYLEYLLNSEVTLKIKSICLYIIHDPQLIHKLNILRKCINLENLMLINISNLSINELCFDIFDKLKNIKSLKFNFVDILDLNILNNMKYLETLNINGYKSNIINYYDYDWLEHHPRLKLLQINEDIEIF